MEVVNKIGRRKTAVARIYLKEGTGVITVNHRDFKQYFPTPLLQYKVEQPMILTDTLVKNDPMTLFLKKDLDDGNIESLQWYRSLGVSEDKLEMIKNGEDVYLNYEEILKLNI